MPPPGARSRPTRPCTAISTARRAAPAGRPGGAAWVLPVEKPVWGASTGSAHCFGHTWWPACCDELRRAIDGRRPPGRGARHERRGRWQPKPGWLAGCGGGRPGPRARPQAFGLAAPGRETRRPAECGNTRPGAAPAQSTGGSARYFTQIYFFISGVGARRRGYLCWILA